MDQVIGFIAQIYRLLIIVAAVLSWIEVDPAHPAVVFVRRYTEPVFAKVRGFVPPAGRFDLSPVVVFLLTFLAEWLLTGLICGRW